MSSNTKSSKAKAETNLSEEQRRQYVEVAAYYIAERAGFNGDCELENWLAAEAEIDRLMAEDKL
ncbi:MAG: DUF2934 domain-containing protein [Acidithiobacillus ferrivorans]